MTSMLSRGKDAMHQTLKREAALGVAVYLPSANGQHTESQISAFAGCPTRDWNGGPAP